MWIEFPIRGGVALTIGINIGNQQRVEVRNGSVRNFEHEGISASGIASGTRLISVRASGSGGKGIQLPGYASLVDGCHAVGNGGDGITVLGPGSLVINSIARLNTGYGLRISHGGFRSNTFTDNNMDNANDQVILLVDSATLGSNYCGTNTSR